MKVPRGMRGLRVAASTIGVVALIVLLGASAAATASVSSTGTSASARAGVAAADGPAVSAVRGDVNDFTFNSFAGDYTLGRDSAGHATLTTVETLDAQFPTSNQNHGILRAIPLKYDGHPTDVSIVSVTDGSGAKRSYSTDTQNGLLLLTIAAPDYVHGSQVYVITYTQNNVVQYFADTNDQEFYWDTNGTAWKQPFGSVTATVHIASDLTSALNGKTSCYVGAQGSSQTCDISAAADSTTNPAVDGTAFQASASNLGAGENLTVAIGFAPTTFTLRDNSFFASGAAIAELIFALLAVLVAVGAIILRLTVLRDAPGRPTIIAEYTVPKGVNLPMASVVSKTTKRAPAASFVSLAVRHNIQIVEQEKESSGLFGGSGKTYWLRLASVEGLDATELDLARLLFGDELQIGAWKQIEKQDTALSKGIYGLMQSTRKGAITEGYIRGGTNLISSLFALAVILFGVLAFFTGTAAMNDDFGGALPLGLLVVCGLSLVVVFTAAFKKPLTAKGSELRDYIQGVELYIRLAEKDRFAMLQTPEGALKTQVNAPDWGQVVKIYEKLLPYAVLLGLEDEWAKVLGTYYESLGSQPDWYSGNSGVFNAVLFASAINSWSSVVDSSLAASTSSSSSGGSGGGGFSGGGGGGGGGGGV
ncbi:DUF2207 domain-containing protein [Subtercola sp. PAMC28395]|uniref:DUF2207 domain-containing protein n=1 Tax=Subtercola sp. PAMC28395 TaxID=2846775 RepID=UPI001C0DA81D|nr:DUF2207 domain-containing protein [Subtercola sp. PAMC28395]QWT24760.1 DUF2207 domain-containing protein [Subtercola sp. PAMC28395]